MSMKQTLVGPNSRVIVYDMPFNEKNLKTLFEKRIDDNISFVVKGSRNVGIILLALSVFCH
jgi:hypothetical protein